MWLPSLERRWDPPSKSLRQPTLFSCQSTIELRTRDQEGLPNFDLHSTHLYLSPVFCLEPFVSFHDGGLHGYRHYRRSDNLDRVQVVLGSRLVDPSSSVQSFPTPSPLRLSDLPKVSLDQWDRVTLRPLTPRGPGLLVQLPCLPDFNSHLHNSRPST